MKGSKRMVRWAWAGLVGTALWSGANPVALAQTGTPPAKVAPVIPADKTIAIVNGEKIVYGQIEPLLRQSESGPEMDERSRRELMREALGLIIDDALLTQYLQKYVPPPSAQDVKQRMAELEAGLKEKKRTLADLCKENHQTEAEVRQNIVQLMQWNQFAQKQITDAQLLKYYQDYKDFFDRVRVRASHIFLADAGDGNTK